MQSLITTAYFYGPLEVAQLEQSSVAAELQKYITQYETEYLRLVLGVAIYNNLADDVIGATAPYLKLKSGGDYSVMGYVLNFSGLVDATAMRSPIANYVYCKYAEDHASVTAGTGEKTAKATNAVDVTVRYKHARAWNAMVKQNLDIYAYIANTPELISIYKITAQAKELFSARTMF